MKRKSENISEMDYHELVSCLYGTSNEGSKMQQTANCIMFVDFDIWHFSELSSFETPTIAAIATATNSINPAADEPYITDWSK